MEFRFNKGDYVKYSSNGVCLIEDLKIMKSPATGKQTYFYILKPTSGNTSTIYAPVDNEQILARMRPILSKKEIDNLIYSVRVSGLQWIDDRKERMKYFKASIINGNIEDLLKIISSIYIKKRELETENKRLSATDDGILKQAESIVNNEFSFALKLSGNQIGEYIRNKLNN